MTIFYFPLLLIAQKHALYKQKKNGTFNFQINKPIL